MSQARVHISSQGISDTLWKDIQVRQALNEHWTCRIELRNTLDEKPKVEEFIGQPLKVSTFSLLGEESVIFSGFIITAQLVYEVTGSYGAVVEAVSDTWKMDQATRHAYFQKKTASDAAKQVAGRYGLNITGAMPSGPELSYAQWDETDFAFVLRLVDDTEAWLRPSVSGDSPGIEVQTEFQSGPTVEWRQGEYGLVEWRAGAALRPLKMEGYHYDPLPMESQYHSDVTDDVPFYGNAAESLVSSAKQQGTQLPAAYVVERHRSVNQGDYNQRLQRESRRALASSVVCHGLSREQQVRAGDAITVSGLTGVDATYGVTSCTHHWTPKGYENSFTATPAQHWSQAVRPPRPSLTGIYPACVVANHDPHNQGRIKVRYWWQDESETTWVRLITGHAGSGRGSLMHPEIGDEVAIIFEGGDPERPYIVGSLWNGVQQPPTQGYWSPGSLNGSEFDENNIKRFVTKSGHRITAVDSAGKETLTASTPKSNRFMMTEKANETGRPAIVLESQGDIILAAPEGRIHFVSKTQSKEVG
ncbi:MAG TPA: phage baseplate assembly protein V [Pseudacidobacterium sp.]|jgi:uncharacterized protein involved in type VI secretion and phage assembly|nr:phage baseplate assembly protein V [Pseudacidobacterium sp.]